MSNKRKQGTSAEEPLEVFEPYRKGDVKVGENGYVKVNVKGYGTVWATANKLSPDEIKKSGGEQYNVELLGSGPSPVFKLSDFTPEEQAKLLTTIPEPHNPTRRR
ncbi:MAG: hypothetical protein AUG51_02695 [Acidobacteria bacterium 13_1_20CM_3_53_8]|nr:MAG: hypothetical protein AUG51_02695 [Acidobacteria bacterium 13_1_20CM_3_53_8]